MDALTARRAALEHLGFVPTEHTADTLVCARVRWHWDLFMRASTIVRIRRLPGIDVATARKDLADWMRTAPAHDWSKVPRGFLQFRAVVDVLLVEQADEELKRWAAGHVAKGYGASGHVVVIEPDGAATFATPVWGAAYWPKTRQVVEVAASGEPSAEPSAPLGAAIGWLLMVPSTLTVVLSCCGLPLLAVPLVRLGEQRPEPAAPPG